MCVSTQAEKGLREREAAVEEGEEDLRARAESMAQALQQRMGEIKTAEERVREVEEVGGEGETGLELIWDFASCTLGAEGRNFPPGYKVPWALDFASCTLVAETMTNSRL